MAGLDREARPGGPLHRRAGVVGDRPLAAEFEEAPALARGLTVERLCELATLVERAAIAAIVDGLPEERLRPAEIVELRHAKGKHLDLRTGDDFRNRRAAGDVDDGLVLDDLSDADRAGRIRVRVRNAAVGCAGAECDDRRSPFGRFSQHVEIAHPADRRVARIAERNRAIHDQDVPAPVLAHGLQARLVDRIAGGRLQSVLVVEPDRLENHLLDRRAEGAREGLRAARALLEREPDDPGRRASSSASAIRGIIAGGSARLEVRTAQCRRKLRRETPRRLRSSATVSAGMGFLARPSASHFVPRQPSPNPLGAVPLASHDSKRGKDFHVSRAPSWRSVMDRRERDTEP